MLVAAVAVEAAADDVADVELAFEQSSAISVNHVETSAESPPWYRHTLTACWNSSEQAQVESVLKFGIGSGQGQSLAPFLFLRKDCWTDNEDTPLQ